MVAAYLDIYRDPLLVEAGLVLALVVIVTAVVFVIRRFGDGAGTIVLALAIVPVLAFFVLIPMFLDVEIGRARGWPEKYELAERLGVDLRTYPESVFRFPANYFAKQVKPGSTKDDVLAIMTDARARYRCEVLQLPPYSERYIFLSDREDGAYVGVLYESGDLVTGVYVGPRESEPYADPYAPSTWITTTRPHQCTRVD